MHYKPLSSSGSAILSLWLAGIGFVLSSCSTLSGQKVDPTTPAPADGTSKSISGIPYTLNKPEFTLTIAKPAEGGARPTFSLSVSYVPDPSQHYTIAPAPGLFSDPNFTLSIDGTGTVTALTAKTTDQLAPTILAVGKFAAAVVGFSATTMDADRAGPSGVFDLLTDPHNLPTSCLAPSDLPRLWRMSIEEIPRPKTDPAIDAEKTNVQLALRAKSFPNESTMAARFHAITPGEYACVSDLVAPYKKVLEARPSAWNTITLKPEHRAKESYFNTFTKEEKVEISAAIAKGDQDTLDKIWTKNPPSDNKKKAEFDALKGYVDTLIGSQNPNKDLLISILNLKFESWKARQIGFLIGRSERFQQLSLSTTSDSERRADLADAAAVDKQVIATVDSSGLEQRKAELERFMTRALSVNLDGRHIAAAQEFTLARTEFDAVTKQLADLKAKYLLMLTPQAATPSTPEPGSRAAALCTKRSDKVVVPVDSNSNPEFCVVLGSAP